MMSAEVEVGQGVAADDQERLGQQVFRVLDAASCSKRRLLTRIGDAHAEL